MCSTTPRFSYECPKVTVPCTRTVVRGGACGAGGYQVGVPGWVYRVGTREGYTGTYPACSREVPQPEPAKRAPEAPQGLEWVGSGVRWDRRLDGHPPTLRARSVHPVALPGGYPRIAASWPIGRDSTSFTVKLVKTGKCRHNVSKRPVIVPISQNGSESHLLEF